jgi:hypothetical protein
MNDLQTLCFELCALRVKIHFAAFGSPMGRQLDFGDVALSTKNKVKRPNLGFAL